MDRLGAMTQFVRVVEAGSFSAAARGLGQGQPTLSKAVAQLESRLGVTLLTRTTRALSLTPAGQAFYDRAKAALDAADEAEAAARGADAALVGRLRICAPVTFARLHILPILPDFMAAHRALDLELVLDDRRIDLIEEGIDVAIRAGPVADSALVAVTIGEGVRRVVASPQFWENAPHVAQPADLAMLPFIAYGSGQTGLDWTFTKAGQSQTVRMRQRIRISALEGVREAVFAGIGFAILSDWASADALESEIAQARLTSYCLPTVELRAFFPAGRQPSARARSFVQFLRGRLRSAL